MTTIANITAAQLAVLGKLVADAAKANRPNLMPGEYTVKDTITVDIHGTVTVGEDYEQQIVQIAKPWNLLTAALKLANEQLIAAGLAGIDMETVVKAAETLDPEALKAAKDQASAEVARQKAPTLKTCNGKVRVAAGGLIGV